MITITNAYQKKVEATKEQIEAKIDELKAQLKEASADTRLSLKGKLHDLEKLLD